MLIVKHDYMNPYFNHAAEDYLMENFNQECFILWRNTKSILVGKNQNTLSEINLDYVKEKDITIVRRMSGGGAVFCDEGNLCFTFISNIDESKFADFESFARPIISSLINLGIKDVEFSGRNDITIDGKKISGNAQYRHKGRILHHGTLLYSADLSELIGGLNVRPVKFKDKAVKSVKGRVTNIVNHMENPLSVEDFKEYVINHVVSNLEDAKIYEFTEHDISEIQKIIDNKYSTWEWNFGNSPKYDFHSEDKFASGVVEVFVNVEKGLIKEIKFCGDFFGKKDIGEFESYFIGKKHDEEEIKNILSEIDATSYINNIKTEEIISLLFN
ncbi:lipoate--protein ligase [Clostridium cylindrosporum]|uniref:lipoate--protein ligase n=1 Tax=Clostridium cylindrosporum DSM 605 TaxID=1121307 RepID=A0A0J8G012_CLOCY|nr:lipoate--protein ligase [Clostridium cylindrosporum]KMT21141.1 lipoate-protein ligase LplJ [Clostridium cylindrosporum DSM 605]